MKNLMSSMLKREVVKTSNTNTAVIAEFRKKLSSHFERFELSENITTLARTASYLSLEHMVIILCNEHDLTPFIDPFIEHLA